MLPALHHRLLIVVAVVVGCAPWWLFPTPLTGPQGIDTATLLFARLAPGVALLGLVLMMLPALLGGILIARLISPLSGAFTVFAVLLITMTGRESLVSWSHAAEPPLAYLKLAIEAAIWLVLIAMTITVLYKAGPKPPARRPVDQPPATQLIFLDWQALAGTAITGGIAAVGIALLGASPDTKQMMPAVLLPFVVGSLIAGMSLQRCGGLPILIAPLCVAIVAYVHALVSYATPEAYFAALYARQVSGFALALPSVYASAGTLGCAIGLGIANFAHESVAAEQLVAGSGQP